MLMTPGDIVMMLNEMGGLRVQATSPSLGRGERADPGHARPLHAVPVRRPAALRRAAGRTRAAADSADGSRPGRGDQRRGVSAVRRGAMGGVVNLLSRRPGDEPEHEVLFNQSTRGATDGVLWLSTPLGGAWGLTLLASGHYQKQTDVDDDGWADLAKYTRGVVRPRLFWDDERGRSFFATAASRAKSGAAARVSGASLPATGAAVYASRSTRRGSTLARSGRRSSAGVTCSPRERAFAGAAARSSVRRHARARSARHGVRRGGPRAARRAATPGSRASAIEHDAYDPEDVPRFEYAFTTPGVFVQDDVDLRSWLHASRRAGAMDGTTSTGRSSVRGRRCCSAPGAWTSRFSVGRGFFAPTPLTEETEAAGLTRLDVRRRSTPSAGGATRSTSAGRTVRCR